MELLETIRALLDETLNLSPLPGEGLERALRDRINNRVFQEPLKWPSNLVVSGEQLDVVYYDEDRIPIIYLETKNPSNPWKERYVDEALERAKNRSPTVEWVIITNGKHWERYKLPTLDSSISFDLDSITEERVNNFFKELRAENFTTPKWSEPAKIFKIDDEKGGSELAKALRSHVENLSGLFQELLEAFILQKITIKTIDEETLPQSAFDDWQMQSRHNRMQDIENELQQAIKRIQEEGTQTERERVLEREHHDLRRFVGIDLDRIRSGLNKLLSKYPDDLPPKLEVRKIVYQWMKERNDARFFCIQTAHVLLSRLLFYRISEDKGLTSRRISRDAIQTRIYSETNADYSLGNRTPLFITLYNEIRSHMVNIDPRVYKLALYDWWYVESTQREGLSSNEHKILYQIESHLNRALCGILRTLNRFQLEDVNHDVWREVYQHYIPKKERLQMGGFYTNDKLAKWILELADYKGQNELLDPACGSGTFLVEATKLTRKKLGIPRSLNPDRAKKLLEKLNDKIFGLDIHPFATFLAHINLLFLNIDLVQSATNGPISFTLPQWVYESDYLERPESGIEFEFRLQHLSGVNSRAKETIQRTKEAQKVKAQSLSFIVGNPPWGGILRRGRPLESKGRSYFKNAYGSAHGKYDIYVLFMERALEQLKKDGTLAFLTQNRYLSKVYGIPIKRLLVGLEASGTKEIEEERSISNIIDLGEIGGKIFFPEETNYPCITIVKKKKLTNAKLVRIKGSYKNIPSANAVNFLIKGVEKVLDNLDEKDEVVEKISENTEIIGRRFSQKKLKAWAKNGESWVIEKSPDVSIPQQGLKFTSVLTAFQGATPGGSDETRAQKIMLLSEQSFREREIEEQVALPVIKGENIQPFEILWEGTYAIYPYKDDGSLINLGAGVWERTAKEALSKIRSLIASGKITAPKASLYLAEYYEQLVNRNFEGNSIRELGKKWYEWHRPRTRKLKKIRAALKVVCPRQLERARFALDTKGYLILDSCWGIIPRKNSKQWYQLKGILSELIEGEPTVEFILQYLVAALNEPYNDYLLKKGGTPSRDGYYTIGHKELNRLIIPIDKDRVKNILSKTNPD